MWLEFSRILPTCPSFLLSQLCLQFYLYRIVFAYPELQWVALTSNSCSLICYPINVPEKQAPVNPQYHQCGTVVRNPTNRNLINDHDCREKSLTHGYCSEMRKLLETKDSIQPPTSYNSRDQPWSYKVRTGVLSTKSEITGNKVTCIQHKICRLADIQLSETENLEA